jgi:hypothetical protein
MAALPVVYPQPHLNFLLLKAIRASSDGSKRWHPKLIRQAEEVVARSWETYQSVGVGIGAA